MDKDEKLYRDELKKLVIKHRKDEQYNLLLDHLWKKEYYSILPNDQNRAKDGIYLRDLMGDVDYNCFGPCRILEMLIALSKRMAYEIVGTGYGITFIDLFWEFIDNLGLTKFDNLAVLQDGQYLELDYILNNWLDRKYAPDGYGGIFPIKDWKEWDDEPQQKVEIWYQMMLYLPINYPL